MTEFVVPPEDMVERAAEAFASWEGDDWSEIGDLTRDYHRERARAVLRAA